MPTEIEGATVLLAVAKEPSAFGMTGTQINTLAAKILIDRIRDKSAQLEQLRSMFKIVGSQNFRLALDGLTAREAAALTKRIDAKHPDIKSTDETWHRRHIAELAEHLTEPSLVQAKTAREPKTAKPGPAADAKTGDPLNAKALKPRARGRAGASKS